MSKFVIILLVAAFAACSNADGNPGDSVGKGIDSGRNMWDGFMQPIDRFMDMGEKAVKDIKPMADGIASGTFTSSAHHTEMRNGKVVTDEGSSKSVTNDNGSVKETSTTD